MPHKPPFLLPEEIERFAALGERLRLARRRRGISSADMARQAFVSRSTVYKLEAGDPGATLGSYFRVLETLGLGADIDKIAADDKVGRRLQDFVLGLTARGNRKRAKLLLDTDWEN